MDLKLEELRKRLLQPVPASPTSYPTLESGREVWSASPLFSQQSPTENSQDTRHRRASAPEENSSARSEAEIVSLGVLPNHRRRGIGSAILDAVCGAARLRGAERVVLEVALDNEAARALYAGRGFTVVGRRRNYYRRAERLVDALILRVHLPTASLPT